MSANQFALEQLEDRQEMISCYWKFYLGVCYKTIGGIRIAYPCVKFRLVCDINSSDVSVPTDLLSR